MKPRSMSAAGPSAAQASEGQQLPPQTAGLQPSKRAVRKVVASLNPTAALEDISEGEEGFPLTDEEDGDTLESDFSDFTDEDVEEEDMISIPRDQGHSGELEEGEIPATVAATAVKKGQGKKSRWDQQVRSTAPLKGARDPKLTKTATQSKKSRRSASAARPRPPPLPPKRARAPRRPKGQRHQADDASTEGRDKLRELIFPTLYAIFQQSRAQRCHLKVKNRSLRSLTRSCLYHNKEEQLQRTLADSEALLSKYCSAAPTRFSPPSYTESPAKDESGPA
ncbi:33K [Bovine mastadenovirus B]|uniref:Protein 33K n=1 Tax=Bovine adenovirus B serotype 3 TaxID=10510 RepID=SF33K_ADEB3|nr:33K [Bovine mastadenovirus B]